MKRLQQVLLLLSSALLLLHSFVPHEHHSDMDSTTHQQEHREANSWLELLRLAFHADLAPNHLQDVPELPRAEWHCSQEQQQEQLLPLSYTLERLIFAVPKLPAPVIRPAVRLEHRFSTVPPPLRAPPSVA